MLFNWPRKCSLKKAYSSQQSAVSKPRGQEVRDMRCLSCGFDNPEGMKFCGECATPLKNRCPECGFENPPGFKFCGEYASLLTLCPSASQTSDSGPRTPDSLTSNLL